MILERWSVPPLHVMQFFFVEVQLGPWFISSTNLAWGLTHLILKIFLQRLVRKRYATKVYDCINSDGSLIKLDTMSNLIKEGYFNVSTMLNLKSLWMHLARRHLLTLHSAPDLYTASARFRVAFPLEYSPKVYQSTEPKRQETIY